MTISSITSCVVALGAIEQRATASRRLAQELGAERALLLVRDETVGAMLPAEGFPRTLRGGPAWREFVSRCAHAGVHRGRADLPAGNMTDVVAACSHDIAAVFLGGHVDQDAIDQLLELMPMLAVLLRAEQEVALARAEASDARALAARNQTLVQALDSARAEHARLNAQLREEHRRKDDFLAMLGHELRNPLAPLVMSIELLRRQSQDDPRGQRQVEIMLRQVRQLSRLVDDLLDISRVSHGRIELHRRRVALAEIVGDAVETARPTLRTMGHALEMCMPGEELWVNADHVRLTQVISNILHNAAKYTPPGGRIEIFMYREGGDACVRVVDNGIGIDEAMLPRVFDLFTQAPASLDRSQGGLGIGLTLVKSLVELHGGRVVAESEGLGKGSAFTVKMPLSAADVAGPQPTATTAHVSSGRSISILVVDDNRDAADTLAEAARSLGHRVGVAYGGLEALQMGPDLQPQLVVLDIGMPEMDGCELARRLRRVVRRDAVFVALSGYGAERERRRSREAGFDDHLVKPLTEAQLTSLIARTTSASRPADA